jgi:hypothetical protein
MRSAPLEAAQRRHRDMVTHPSWPPRTVISGDDLLLSLLRSVLIAFGPAAETPVASGTDCPAPNTTSPAPPERDGCCWFAADPGLDRSLQGLPPGREQNRLAESRHLHLREGNRSKKRHPTCAPSPRAPIAKDAGCCNARSRRDWIVPADRQRLGGRKAPLIAFGTHLFETTLYTTVCNKTANASGCIVQRCAASYDRSLHSKNF